MRKTMIIKISFALLALTVLAFMTILIFIRARYENGILDERLAAVQQMQNRTTHSV